MDLDRVFAEIPRQTLRTVIRDGVPRDCYSSHSTVQLGCIGIDITACLLGHMGVDTTVWRPVVDDLLVIPCVVVKSDSDTRQIPSPSYVLGKKRRLGRKISLSDLILRPEDDRRLLAATVLKHIDSALCGVIPDFKPGNPTEGWLYAKSPKGQIQEFYRFTEDASEIESDEKQSALVDWKSVENFSEAQAEVVATALKHLFQLEFEIARANLVKYHMNWIELIKGFTNHN